MTNDVLNQIDLAVSKLQLTVLHPNHQLNNKLHDSCAVLRGELLARERDSGASQPLSRSIFWDLTPKYRLDILLDEIPNCFNQLVYAIAMAWQLKPSLAPIKVPHYRTRIDALFWHHIDFALRLVSSGWDRIAILLDMAFETNVERDCSLRTILKALPKKDSRVTQHELFIDLKNFFDSEFLTQVEGKSTLGSRHEVTHIISPITRHFHEFLNDASGASGEVPASERPSERIRFLCHHHGKLINGLESATSLVGWKRASAHTPSK